MTLLRSTPFLFALSICLFAQTGAVRREAGRAAGSGEGAAGNLSQGQSEGGRVVIPAGQPIVSNNRHARFLLIYPEGMYAPGEVEKIRSSVEHLSDVVAGGAKLTKADAARSGAGGAALEALAGEVRQRLQANGVAGLALNVLPAGETAKQIQCPPPNCGCRDDGGGISVSCSCTHMSSDLGEHCMCLLCYSGPKLTPFPENDPVLTSLRQNPAGAAANPGAARASEKPAYVIVVATRPDAPASLRQRLLQAGVKTIESEPWPARLTIKTKSSPR